MSSPYPNLPRDVAATVPRRGPFRHSWVKDSPPRPSTPSPTRPRTPTSTMESLPTPTTPPDIKISPYNIETRKEVIGCEGLVSRAKALFEAPPDSPRPPPRTEPPVDEASVWVLSVRNPYHLNEPRKVNRRHMLMSPPRVDQAGDLIHRGITPSPGVLRVKRVTPVVLPRAAPRSRPEGEAGVVGVAWGSGEKGAKGVKSVSVNQGVERGGCATRDASTNLRKMLKAPSHVSPAPCRYPRFSDIPRELLDSLEESSVDPLPLCESPGGGTKRGVSQGEARPLQHDDDDDDKPHAHDLQSTPTSPSQPTLTQQNFRGFCDKMLSHAHTEARPHHPRTPTIDEELWAAGVYFRRPGETEREIRARNERESSVYNAGLSETDFRVTEKDDVKGSVKRFSLGLEGGKEQGVTAMGLGQARSGLESGRVGLRDDRNGLGDRSKVGLDRTTAVGLGMPKIGLSSIRPGLGGFRTGFQGAEIGNRDQEAEIGLESGKPDLESPKLIFSDPKPEIAESKPYFQNPGLLETEESVLRELDDSLGGLGGSGGSSPSQGSLRGTSTQPESLNLIEEVVVPSITQPQISSLPPPPQTPPPSTVTLKAYYHTPTPHLHPNLPLDSDSGHESGATSPCGTLTGEEPAAHSPPSSPPTAHTDMGLGVAVVGGVGRSAGVSRMSLEPRPPAHFVVVAIDFGTTYSGYAFSFTSDPESVHMMKQWQGGDPGVQNQKTPTVLLLTPDERFHSLGYLARDTYHDLDPSEAPSWLYFDRFKMVLHNEETLTRDTQIEAANGRRLPALNVFTHALKYFKEHAIRELSEQVGAGVRVGVLEEDIRWVITVPAIWSHPAKQFMRTAAYQAGLGSPSRPDQLLIALEPEVAAIYCRHLRRHQLLPSSSSPSRHLPPHLKEDPPPPPSPDMDRDTVYAVVDCGGGTVDITVHKMTDRTSGHLKELHKATGGPHGSTGVDGEFESLLATIFSADFMATFRKQRPAAHVDLMIAFEARKRNASPYRSSPLNIALPFSFIDLYRKLKGKDVEWAVRKYQHLGVRWSSQGMLRLEPHTMKTLFLPTLNSITKAIEAVLASPGVRGLQYMFLVGGFAESEVLQKHIKDNFSDRVRVVIPQGASLAILRGAVKFGLDPGIVTVRRSRLTYGVGVLNKFIHGIHPRGKRVTSAGGEWCADVLDRFVEVDESIAVGDEVVRSYTPATADQRTVILHLYATDKQHAEFVTEEGVERVGTLHLDLGSPPPPPPQPQHRTHHREISVHMRFGDTEVKTKALDHLTQRCVRADIDFLAL